MQIYTNIKEDLALGTNSHSICWLFCEILIWSYYASSSKLIKNVSDMELMIWLSLTRQFHVNGEGFEFLFIWGILHHQELISNYLQVVQLSWEEGWEVTLSLILVKFNCVGSSWIILVYLEVKNDSRNLLLAVFWLSSCENCNSAIWQAYTTFKMKSINLMISLFHL